MNHITITGNLGKDPITRYTPSGKKCCSFSVACNRTYTGADGEKKETVTWINVDVWNGMGEACQKYLSKGRHVLVEGRLDMRPYVDANGIKRDWVAITASNVEFLDAPKNQANIPAPEEDEEHIPF